MAVFYFKARDLEARLVEGKLEANSKEEAAQQIRKGDLFLLELKEAPKARDFSSILSYKPISTRDLAFFSYQLGAVLGAGLPLLTGLQLAREQFPSRFIETLSSIEDALKEGSTLATAMGRHPEFFPPVMISMIEAGELGGILEDVLTWLAAHFEREATVKEQIKSALAYPLLVLVLTLISLVFLLTFVLPSFASMLGNMGMPLPILTQAVLGTSRLFTKWGLHLGVISLMLGYGAYRIWQSPKGCYWWDKGLIKMPIIGSLMIKIIAARFCRILGALLGNGVPILQSLEVVKKTLSNQMVTESLGLAEISLQEGKGLAEPLAKAKIFPNLVLQMVATGEETGKLPQFLLKVSDFYDKEVDRSLERFTLMLEPTLVLLLGVLVGGIVVAILLPLFSLLGSW